MLEITKNNEYLSLISILSFAGLCYYRSLKVCILSRIKHCEMCGVVCDSIPISEEIITEVLDLENPEIQN